MDNQHNNQLGKMVMLDFRCELKFTQNKTEKVEYYINEKKISKF